MAKSSYVNITRPVRKRSAVTGTLVGVRLQPNQIKAIDAWAAKQVPPVTRPEVIRGMIDAMLHILSKDTGEKPAKKAKRKLNLSPERREQLAAAMRARWAAKRAAEANRPDTSANGDFTIRQVPQSP